MVIYYRKFILLLATICTLLLEVEGQKMFVLEDRNDQVFLDSLTIRHFEDLSGTLDFKTISSDSFSKNFKKIPTRFPENKKPHSVNWIKFTLKTQSHHNWILECFNHHHIGIIELYSPLSNGKFKVETTGDNLKFSQRSIAHINFEFFLKNNSNTANTYYIKYIPEHNNRAIFVLRTTSRFFNYASSEYYSLGIYYGMIFIIFLYNLFFFPRLRDPAYLYYALYSLSVGLFSMTQDGTGFQYLWPNYPAWNHYGFSIFSTSMIVFILLYTQAFLETKNHLSLLHRIITYTIYFRLLLFVLGITVLPELKWLLWIDIFPFLLVYATAIASYLKKNKYAIYFVVGFSILLLAFIIHTLRILKIIPPSLLSVYSINIGALIEMILLSIALTEKLKQFQENELIKESLNKTLEQKVKERTETLIFQKNIIEEKVKTLDTFIYKASHDIKGPLRSLIGVARLGMKDTPDKAHLYFEHTLKTARKLDNILKDLIQITQINNVSLNVSEIKLKEFITEIIESLKTTPGCETVNFIIDIQPGEKFYSEPSLLHSIFQNIIENAIKYRDKTREVSELKMTIQKTQDGWEARFTDNGIGIEEEYQEKIFEMFFKIENHSEDSTGLGLYIVKLCVEKLNGSICIESRKGQGTCFTLLFKEAVSKLELNQ